ncbi:MAG: GNAT family N-acetyltransferase [Firmicutes bacterium]|nr:GNAT family N-acetyltransferase [Bacillota bacterium]
MIVSVASSYTAFREGIEIEIDTEEEYRRKGLASAAGAALILSCLDDGLYPGWDAANLESVHLSEKLGYEFDCEYPCYWLSDVFDRVIKAPDKSGWDAFCGRYQHPVDGRRIYEIHKKDGELYYHFVSPESGADFDLRMYPVGERTFGINEDDFELEFSDGNLILAGNVCRKL